MTDARSRFILSPTARRLIRSYGVLVIIAIAFLLLVLLMRERPETVPIQSMAVRAWL